jgi:hypothetical protein
MYKDIDLTNPKLGADLLRDPQGDLPIDVWDRYFWLHSDDWRPVLAWSVDPSDPDVAAIDPQRAVDEAEPLVAEAIRHLLSNCPAEALAAARKAVEILVHGSSEYQPRRGRDASMQHMAVRAYIIRKFNPDPRKPSQSRVGWARLADILFVNDEKCSRCGLSNHQYDSPCVKALMTAVTRLRANMKHDGIPI